MRRVRFCIPFMLLLFLTSPLVLAQQVSVDFKQAANNDKRYQLGNVRWIQSVLQRNNSMYFEGMSVPQRIMLDNIPKTAGNQHALTFSHLATKNGIHAYDYLTSYKQAKDASIAIAGPNVLVNMNECGTSIGPPRSLGSTCAALHSGPHSLEVHVPDVMSGVLSHDINKSMANYEQEYGNRTITIYGDAPITAATLTFNGYSTHKDKLAEYTLSWTSSSSVILVEMAAHLALGVDVQNAGSGIGYGSGFGAGSISGAPFHFKLEELDGRPLGSRDNQIMSAAIRQRIDCAVSGPTPVCVGTQNTYTFGTALKGLSFSWNISSNSSGASIVGSSTGQSVIVDAGNTTGAYTLTAKVSDGVQVITCTTKVTVSGITVAASATPILCKGGSSTVTVSASGGTAPYTGAGNFSKKAGTYTFTVTDANGCSGMTTVNVSEPSELQAFSSATTVSCSNSMATVDVTAKGGKPPYKGIGRYKRSAGTHTFTVTDDLGCQKQTSVTVTSSPTLTVAASATPIACNGGTSTVTVSAGGGTPPFTGVGTFTRTAGTYSFTVTDANNCSGTATVTITEPPALTASLNATAIGCNGGTSSVTIAASGGTPPYSGTGTFTKSAGTYTFTITDANNCSVTKSVTISEPPTLSISASATAISCSNSNSTVTVAATGGTPPYTGTGTFTKGGGTHSFTVTDANGCSETTSITITAPSSLTASATATPIACNGGTSSVTVSATGGTPPYSGTGTFSKTAGTYNFTVTDANNCTATTSVTVTEPSVLTITAGASTIACNGGTSTVTVAASGGTPPYSGTGTFTKAAGTHTFTVTDANNCSETATVTITEPQAITVTASASTIACNGGNSTVTVTATGGTPPYSGTGTFTKSAGTHTFTVTDANNCTAATSVTISEPPALTAAANATAITCSNSSSTVTVTASGGTPPYSGTGTYTRGAGTHNFTVTDANNCATTTSVTITAPSSLVATASATAIQCYGGSSAVTVAASGGTPPYTGTGTFTKPAGTYSFTVTDANSCTATTSVTITDPTQLNVTSSATPILCNGDLSSITVSASGGTPPYSGTGTFDKAAGTHTFTVTDANNCAATTSVSITEPPALTASVSATAVTCANSSSTVTVTAAGGTPPYAGTGTFTRSGGTHTFIVTDANSCADTVSVTINAPSAITVAAIATNITCNGEDAIVTVSATGGTPPYTGTGQFSRKAGTHTFTVTDANSCSGSATVTITEPPPLDATAGATPIACNGGSSTITITASGGTGPYIGTGTFTRDAGTHSFIVTDANSCADTVSLTINEPPQLICSVSPQQILCNGSTAKVTVSASGGTPPYSGTGTFDKAAGTHIFTVTDDNGCTDSDTITLTEPPLLDVSSSATPILCKGGTTTITIAATGGTQPYTGTGTFTRGAGTYSFTVTDDNNCSATTTITITEPPLLNPSAVATPILCKGEDATVTVTAAGGTPPYTGTGTFTRGAGTYSFTVSDANGCSASTSITITEPPLLTVTANAPPVACNGMPTLVSVSASGGTPPYTGTGSFSRTAGTYTFTVTDNNGCSDSATITITEPPLLTASASATPIACNGDSATVTVSAVGGTMPYTGTGTFRRAAGTYTFVVTDINSCSDTVAITIDEPPLLMVTVTATPILCFGETSTVTVTASGGTGPYIGTGTFTRTSGTHTFTVTDSNGCTAAKTITITEPPLLIASSNAPPILCHGGSTTITVYAIGGTQPYSGTGTFTRSAGTHSFIVTDANGCLDTTSITLVDPPELIASIDATPILCNGGSSTITVSATGGTPPYSGTGTFIRGAGTHTFTVRDANNCAETVTITVTEPPLLVVMGSASPVTCGVDTSTITITATGGTPPYTGTGTFKRMLGTYTFTVTDSNGCTASTQVTVNGPPPVVINVNAPPIDCYGGSSTITVSASGGTPPYSGVGTFTKGPGTYIFTVVDANGCKDSDTINLVEPPELFVSSAATPVLCHGDLSTITVLATGGTPPYSGTGTFVRGAGSYTFTVTDANGCTKVTTVNIDEPPELAANATTGAVNCGRDSTAIVVTASGGTPPYSGTGTFYRTPGVHTFIVMDANGCADTVTTAVSGPPPVYATAAATPILCNGGNTQITVSAYGGTPPYSGTGVFTRKAGTHTFVITDANGCTDTATVVVSEPPALNVICSVGECINGVRQVTASVSGGTPPYDFQWSYSPHNGPMIDIPCTFYGTITLRVRDANYSSNDPNRSSCEAFCSLNIISKVPNGGSKRVRPTNDYALHENFPNPFNPSTTIEYFVPEASHVRLSVINKLGQTIATLVDEEVPAGGHFATWNAESDRGAKVPSGSYFYRIHARSLISDKQFVSERMMLLLK